MHNRTCVDVPAAGNVASCRHHRLSMALAASIGAIETPHRNNGRGGERAARAGACMRGRTRRTARLGVCRGLRGRRLPASAGSRARERGAHALARAWLRLLLLLRRLPPPGRLPTRPPQRSLRCRAVAQRMARARRRIVPPRPPGGPTAHRRWLGPGALGWRSLALAPRPLHLTPALPRAIAARPCFMPRPKTGRSIETYPCSRSPSPAGHAGWVSVPASATQRLWTHGTVTRQSTPLPRRALCT